MAQAFRDIGTEVTLIAGVSAERRKMIREVKSRIRRGEKFDFLYMESNTEPTLLTDPHHLPTHPFLDYGFLKFVRKHGIPVGMFYCDMFWKFPFYGTELPGWKKKSALACYRYDLREYEKWLNIFYCPNAEVFPKVLGSEKLGRMARTLLPGAEDLPVSCDEARDFAERPLTVIYVGGITGHYRIGELLKAVGMTPLFWCCMTVRWSMSALALASIRRSPVFSYRESMALATLHELLSMGVSYLYCSCTAGVQRLWMSSGPRG
jgi:hypothetical protein